jgi:RNA polymerase sigma-70 factor (ECF subfamily)
MKNSTYVQSLLEHQRDLLAYAYSLTKNKQDAYDLLQDTSLRAIHEEENCVHDKNIKGWLFTLMHNIFINNYHREKRRKTRVHSTEEQHEKKWGQVACSSNSEEHCYKNDLLSFVSLLPEENSEPIRLFIDGFRYVEIAKRLSLPLSTVKSRIFKGRQLLRKRFDKEI